MKAMRVLLTWTILSLLCGLTFAQDASPSPESLRAMLQAKKVYLISGHVRYWKTKGLIKSELVDETPFEEPCREELEKWGRFALVPDIKGADLVIRAYEKDNHSLILDVWQPSSRKVIWSASKNLGTSWSTHTGIANLVKKLREYIEEEDKIAPTLNGVSNTGSANPQN